MATEQRGGGDVDIRQQCYRTQPGPD